VVQHAERSELCTEWPAHWRGAPESHRGLPGAALTTIPTELAHEPSCHLVLARGSLESPHPSLRFHDDHALSRPLSAA
jgi:hypothetical protein